jgi:type I restriction enzyme S subunit
MMLLKIGDFCLTGSGGTPARDDEARYYHGTIPWVKSGELKESVILSTEEMITEVALRESSAKLAPVGSLLVAMYGATIGRVAILGIPAATNQAVCYIQPNPDIADSRYIFHALCEKTPHWISRGAGGAQPNISQGIVRDTRVFIPPLSEQRRIADILDRADAIRAKRRAALARLEELTQAIFVELFGDPMVNAKGWPRVRFGNLLDSIDSGWSPNCMDRPVQPGEWGVLKLGAITRSRYDPSENKALPVSVEPDRSLEVKKGDVLFARKNTYELVAASVFVKETPPRMLLPDLIFRFQVKPEAAMTKQYLHALLAHPQKRKAIQSLAGGASGSMPNISKGRLQEVLMEVPPLSLQEQFAARIEAVEGIRSAQEKAISMADALFSSLQDRAFRGAL